MSEETVKEYHLKYMEDFLDAVYGSPENLRGASIERLKGCINLCTCIQLLGDFATSSYKGGLNMIRRVCESISLAKYIVAEHSENDEAGFADDIFKMFCGLDHVYVENADFPTAPHKVHEYMDVVMSELLNKKRWCEMASISDRFNEDILVYLAESKKDAVEL